MSTFQGQIKLKATVQSTNGDNQPGRGSPPRKYSEILRGLHFLVMQDGLTYFILYEVYLSSKRS